MIQDNSAELVMRLHRATGLPAMEAKRLLAAMNPEEQLKYIRAAENAQGRLLRDPIEDDPEIGPIIQAVMQSVTEQVQEDQEAQAATLEQTSPLIADMIRTGRGRGLLICRLVKEQLKRDHGIDWKTPAEMTPWVVVD